MHKRALIIDLFTERIEREDMDFRIQEIESLVSTYGDIEIVEKIQKQITPDYKTYIGSGKLQEISELVKEKEIDLVIFGTILKPRQIWNITQHFHKEKSHADVWDRIDLILKIFQQHALSPESKLQIQLASIRHMGPRIFGMGMELDRQGGGIGTIGKGETNTEIMKRHLKEHEKTIRKKLDKYSHVRKVHREWRDRKNIKVVGIVGYTNAGKSTLFNFLTKKWVLAEDKLFATLGTSVAKMKREVVYDPSKPYYDILLNDTIGFIRDLPPKLIEAFSSTLEDSAQSDILLEVIDASDPQIEERIEVVAEILEKIWATQERFFIFNKLDACDEQRKKHLEEKYADLNPIYISAKDGIGIEKVKNVIETIL